MIIVTIRDLKKNHYKEMTESLSDLEEHPYSRVKFFNNVNRMVSMFIYESIGKTKKTMKQLDKEG